MSETMRKRRIAESRKVKKAGDFADASRLQTDWEAVYAILDRVHKLPTLDNRTADEIIGYNEFGLFDEEGDFSLTDVKRA